MGKRQVSIQSFFGGNDRNSKRQAKGSQEKETPNENIPMQLNSDAPGSCSDSKLEGADKVSSTACENGEADRERDAEPVVEVNTDTSISELKEDENVSSDEDSFVGSLESPPAPHAFHPSWNQILVPEFKKPYFTKIKEHVATQLKRGKTIYPPMEDVYNAFNLCRLDELKVVILGQDPYHGPSQAHGLCFSVQHGIAPPPSLKNVYKEALADVQLPKPSHGCLEHWAKQGVLLLNAVLTVERGQPNSHKKIGWERFTDAVVRGVSDQTEGVVFLLWGKPAQAKGASINRSKHLVLTSSHPSPLGATKTASPFIGSRCFSKANAYLEEQGKAVVDWTLP